jgi:hypothetical protein
MTPALCNSIWCIVHSKALQDLLGCLQIYASYGHLYIKIDIQNPKKQKETK